MSGGIFLIQAENQLIEMKEEQHRNEDAFQELLAKYPSLLDGDLHLNELIYRFPPGTKSSRSTFSAFASSTNSASLTHLT